MEKRKRRWAFRQTALAFGRGLEVQSFIAVEISIADAEAGISSEAAVAIKNFLFHSESERVRDFHHVRAFSSITWVVIKGVTKAVIVDFAT
jgi:hypothetical protein